MVNLLAHEMCKFSFHRILAENQSPGRAMKASAWRAISAFLECISGTAISSPTVFPVSSFPINALGITLHSYRQQSSYLDAHEEGSTGRKCMKAKGNEFIPCVLTWCGNNLINRTGFKSKINDPPQLKKNSIGDIWRGTNVWQFIDFRLSKKDYSFNHPYLETALR